eukprot:g1532.t1
MAGGGGGGGGGKGHKQATPEQIAELRKLLSGLEATNANVLRYRWLTDDRMLHRFITARNGNVDVALKMLLDHLDWRVSYKLDTILDEDLSGAGVSHEFYWSGFDRDGRPCLVFRAAEHRKSDPDGASPTVEEKVRYYCQLLERGFREFAPAHKFCLILDCRGAGTNVMDRKLFKVATPIIENNFPETQHATYVLPCNGIITMAWKVISSFIDPGTADKIRLVKDFDDQALVEAFTPETLKAFVTLDPSLAPPQPYVAPDPLANPPPPSRSSTSVLSNGVRGSSTSHNNDNNNNPSHHHQHSSLPSSSGLLPPPSDASSSTRLPPQHARPSAATLAAANAVPGGGGGDDDDSSVLLPPPSPGGSTLFGVNAGPSPSGSQMQPPFPDHQTGENGTMQPAPLSPAGAAAAVRRRAGVAAEAAAVSGRAGGGGGGGGGRGPPSPSGSASVGQHQPAAPPSPAGDSLYAVSTAGGTEGGADGGGGGPKENVFDERFIGKSTASAGSAGFGGGGVGDGASIPTPPVVVASSMEAAAAGGARPPAAAMAAPVRAAGGGVGEGVTQPAASRAVEFTERAGVLYKRRDTLRGRFAYRQKYAVLRFPPSEAASLASRRCAPGAGMPPTSPPPPTLSLLKGRGQTQTEKIVSLEGAEVTLGTAMAGTLYPLVISFSAPQRVAGGGARKEPRRQPPEPAIPPRRNTEDFMFTGVLDPSGSSSVAGSDAAAGGGADYRPHRFAVDDAVDGTGGGKAGWAGNGMPPGGPGVRSASASRLTSPYLQRTSSNVSSSSIMTGGGRKRSDSMGSSVSGATRQRKTLHLGCETEEQTLQWARRSHPNGGIREAAFSPGKAPPLPPRKDGGPRSTFAKRKGSSRSFLGGKGGKGGDGSIGSSPLKATAASFSQSSSAAAGAVLKGLGEAGGALMSMRDSEISRLRRAYARSELSREEMKRCLRALAVQLREGEDRTGALLADREAVLYEINTKEAEFAKKEALLEEDKARASAEAEEKAQLVSSLQVENQALQAAVERLRHDFQEERSLRLQREKKTGAGAAPAPAPAAGASPSTPARGDGGGGSRLGILGRRSLKSRNSLPADAARTPSRLSGVLPGPGVHNHNVRSTPHRARSSGGVGAAAEAAAVAAAAAAAAAARGGRGGAAGWESNHGGIGSRHSVPTMLEVERGVANEDGEALPWVLNTDETWEGAARPPHDVLAHLLEELEDIMAAASADSSDCATTPLVTPQEDSNGGLGAARTEGDTAAEDGGGSRKLQGAEGAGGEGKGFVGETEAFVRWSRRTGELQKVPPLESVDLPGEKEFTEGCIKLLSAHAAAVLHKEPGKLTAREEARMAYAIGDGMYTISRLSNHLDALVAGLPTEAGFSTSAATATTPQQHQQQHHHHHHHHSLGHDGPLRVAAPPPRAVWKAPPAAAVGVQRREARGAIHPEVSHFILPRPPLPTSAMLQGPIRPQQVGPAPPGDLRLVEFMEQVKHELWEFNAMPLRKRFRVQSLLRRLHTPPLESWSGALARATEDSPRPFTRTLLARHEAASSLAPAPTHWDVKTPGFDLLLLCWRPGANSVIHDHPNAGCWVKVLKGELRETRYSLAPDGSGSAGGGHSNSDSDGISKLSSGTSSPAPCISSDAHADTTSGPGVRGACRISVCGSEELEGAGGLVKTSTVTCNAGTVTYIEDSMGLHKMENPSPTEECISLHLYSPGISECTTWADASTCASDSVKAPMCLDDDFLEKKQRLG